MVSRRSGYLVLLSALLPLVLISPCLSKPSGNARDKSKWNSGRRGLAIFVPTLGQRQLLRDIQVTAEALRRIEPDPSAGWVFGNLLFRRFQPEVFGHGLLEWPEPDVDRIAENCADVGRLPTGPGPGPDGGLWKWILAHAICGEL
jgi:hypothetical protein